MIAILSTFWKEHRCAGIHLWPEHADLKRMNSPLGPIRGCYRQNQSSRSGTSSRRLSSKTAEVRVTVRSQLTFRQRMLPLRLWPGPPTQTSSLWLHLKPAILSFRSRWNGSSLNPATCGEDAAEEGSKGSLLHPRVLPSLLSEAM